MPIWTKVDNEYDYFWGWTDERLFGEAVESLIADPIHRMMLGRLGPPHVRGMFNWAEKARQFVELIAAAVPQEVAA